MKRRMCRAVAVVTLGLLCVMSGLALAKEKPKHTLSSVFLEVRPTKQDGLYSVGEAIRFSVQAFECEATGPNASQTVKKQDAKCVPGVNLTYWITGDGGLGEKGTITSEKAAVIIETKLDRPGFVICKVQESTLNWWQHKGEGGAGVEPLKIQAGVKKPADFEAFWQNEITELYKTPIKTIQREKYMGTWSANHSYDEYRVKISGPGYPTDGSRPYVTGWLGIPKNAKPKSHPAVVNFPGAGTRNPRLPKSLIDQLGFIAMAIEIHSAEVGEEKSYYSTEARAYLNSRPSKAAKTWEESLQLNYHRTKILRTLQALRYLKEQPEWDGRILVTTGGSQGGGLSIIAASLDKDVTACMASYPGYCDQFGHVLNQNGGWPDMMSAKASSKKRRHGKPVSPFAEKTVPYFDAVNFARQMKADIVMTTGFIDTTCPPTSVYAAYNQIPEGTYKAFHYGVTIGHQSPEWDSLGFLRQHMERRGVTPIEPAVKAVK